MTSAAFKTNSKLRAGDFPLVGVCLISEKLQLQRNDVNQDLTTTQQENLRIYS
jgi:hypothetical protein